VALAAVLAWLATIPLLRAPIDGRFGSLVGQPAPELTATDLDGREWSLSDAADGRIVWVGAALLSGWLLDGLPSGTLP
jgi:hypothetical protein